MVYGYVYIYVHIYIYICLLFVCPSVCLSTFYIFVFPRVFVVAREESRGLNPIGGFQSPTKSGYDLPKTWRVAYIRRSPYRDS